MVVRVFATSMVMLCAAGCLDPASGDAARLGASGGPADITSTPSSTARGVPSGVEAAPSSAPNDASAAGSSSHAIPSAGLGAASALPSASVSVPDERACPVDMIAVGRSCVDRFEAFLATPDGTPHPYFERPAEGVRYAARNEAGSFPQAYISRVESKRACEAAGKRLCSRSEWMRACRFKGWGTFPYEGRGARGRCNSGKIHLLTQMFPHPAGGMKYDEHFNSPELNKTPGFLAKSGELATCTSDLGTGDMVGNLHEWVSDTVTQDLVDKMAEEGVERRDQPWQEGNGVFMGGFFSTTSEHGPGCTFTTIAHEPTYHDYSTGFRCCKSLPPPPKKLPARAP